MSPQDGATGVSRTTNVKVTFSETMLSPSINGDTFRLYSQRNVCDGSGCSTITERIPATVSKDPTDDYGISTIGKTFVLDPYGGDATRLAADTRFMVEVTTGVTADSSLHMKAAKIWYFSTAPQTIPTVTSVSPPDGATVVSRSTNIKVTFSEAMDPASINTSTLQLRYYDVLCTSRYYDPYNPCYFSMYQISATVSKDPSDPSGRTWVIDPEGLLYANKNYMVRVTTGVRDIDDGLSISSNKEWYFKTGTY